MRQFLIMAALFLLSSCSPKVFPVQRDTVTHVRTEIVERLVCFVGLTWYSGHEMDERLTGALIHKYTMQIALELLRVD